MTQDVEVTFDGNKAVYPDGREVFVGNNGEHFICRFLNSNGDENTFCLNPEAAQFVAIQILSQFEQIKQ